MANPIMEELSRAAEVAKIKLDEAELKMLYTRFTTCLQWLEPLLKADFSAFEPQLFGHGAINVLREDRAVQRELQGLEDCAASYEDGFYVVPPIIE